MSQISDLEPFMGYHARQTHRAHYRETGFYWIRLKGERWIIAEWVGEGWIVARAHETVNDDLVAEVREKRLLSPDQALLPPYMLEVPKSVPPKIAEALGRLHDAMGS